MVEDLHRQRVLNFLDAFYSGDIDAALACCDDEFDSITHAPIELFPHLGHKHGKNWIAEAIRTRQKRYSTRKYEIKFIAVDGDKVATILHVSLRKRSDDRIVLWRPRNSLPSAADASSSTARSSTRSISSSKCSVTI